jgi:HEPN domain-containing protein
LSPFARVLGLVHCWCRPALTRIVLVNRLQLQRLATIRLADAEALIDKGRWAAAYYLAGYAIECGLKACLLKHLGESGAVFGDPAYLKELAKCWTHDLMKLVTLAGLEANLSAALRANPGLVSNWGLVKAWEETSRYEEKDEASAKALYQAITDNADGVFQ